jgi:drug/metabolite transporter (DMT)-like permease
MKRWIAYAGLAITVALWGASFIATKVVLPELSPAAIVFVRFAMGFAVLAIAVRWRRIFQPVARRDVPLLMLLGFLGVTFHVWLQATGMQTASATTTAWIVATTPIFVALISRLFLKEALGVVRISGITLAAMGALVVVSRGDLLALRMGKVGAVGDWLILGSSLNWALFTVLSKRVIGDKGGHPLGLLLYVVGFGWIFSIPWAALGGGFGDIGAISGQGWLALIFLGVFCSGLGFIFWYRGLAEVEATQVGVFLYFEPLVTTLLAGPILGESLHVAIFIGGAAILLGVGLVNQR